MASGGTLFERIVQQRIFDEREVRRAARDVFHGLEFLHNDALLMHRDIKFVPFTQYASYLFRPEYINTSC